MDDMISSATSGAIAQTEENTQAPHEGTPKVDAVRLSASPKKRVRLTPKQRAAKIAAGWNPPGRKPNTKQNAPSPELTKALETLADMKIAQPVRSGPTDAEVLLKALVDKLVAIENNAQYASVWHHFFVHGGVYIGPKYIDELHAAINYLIGIESAETSVG